MPQVFLSYRRRDNDHALSIYLWLIKRYGRESVFWDRKDIDVGPGNFEFRNVQP